MANYTTQTEVENYLGRDLTTTEAAIVANLIASVQAYIDDELGSGFGTVSETSRYYDGGSKILHVDPCYDITAVAAVDSLEVVMDTYLLNDEFEARPRNNTVKTFIEKRLGAFPKGVANIKVTAKFSRGEDVPEDIQFLATKMVAEAITNAENINLKSESIEGYSRTFVDKQMQDAINKEMLDKYQQDVEIMF